MKVTNLEERIISFLNTQPNKMATDWAIAGGLYKDFNKGSPSNGARVANIRKAVYKSPFLGESNSGNSAFIRNTFNACLCISSLLTRIDINIDRDKALSIWVKCKKDLLNDFPDTLREIEISSAGSLDTYDRDILRDVIGETITGNDWPSNGDGVTSMIEFIKELKTALEVD